MEIIFLPGNWLLSTYQGAVWLLLFLVLVFFVWNFWKVLKAVDPNKDDQGIWRRIKNNVWGMIGCAGLLFYGTMLSPHSPRIAIDSPPLPEYNITEHKSLKNFEQKPKSFEEYQEHWTEFEKEQDKRIGE